MKDFHIYLYVCQKMELIKPKIKNLEKKWKLNMLEPGTKTCAISGVLLILAVIFHLMHKVFFSQILAVLSCLVLAVLLILVRIELYQNKKEYLKAKRENRDVK